jgi:tRNA G18 (ribose-2'-O)-methylase SpoU
MKGVVLYQVGRNLNRSYRTCEAFGVAHLHLLECNAHLSGALFAAAGRVAVQTIQHMPVGGLALETWGDTPLCSVDWSSVEWLVLGGETGGLPRRLSMPSAHIPMYGHISGLTVEAALAIALYAWRQTDAHSG